MPMQIVDDVGVPGLATMLVLQMRVIVRQIVVIVR